MFKKILEYFKGETTLHVDAQGDATDEDLRMAVAIFLLNTAGRDDDYAPEELRAVYSTMQEQFQIDEEEAQRYLEIADEARKDKEKVNEFVRNINARFNEQQRTMVLAMTWRVVLADGKIEDSEKKFFEQVRNRLRLSPEAATKAQRLVNEGKV